jgi:hypothetical protein
MRYIQGGRAPALALVALLAAWPVATVLTQPGAAEFYAAPAGRPTADGSRESPWDLQTALNQPTGVRPGATIWLRGGTYSGGFVSKLHGQQDGFITVRAYPGERPILDNPIYDAAPPKSPLSVEGPYVTIWGLEITSSNPARVNTGSGGSDFRPIGINVLAPHTKLINNIVHDTGNCIGHWVQATDAEVYGNLLYFCGWDGPTRGAGHGLYIQNSGATKDVRDNIVFDEFGFGIHAYTEGGALDDLRFQRNVVFEAGMLSSVAPGGASDILVGGRKIAARPLLEGNFTYRSHGTNSLGYRAGTDDAVVKGNHFIAGKDGTALALVAPRNLSLTGNTFVGHVTDAEHHPDNRYESDPHGVWSFVVPNAYDSNRATLIVYNWGGADTVNVDLGSFLAGGDAYELHNVQDYFTDVARTTSTGDSVVVSMRGHSVGVPVGWHAPPTTFPTFGVFVLIKTVQKSVVAQPFRAADLSRAKALRHTLKMP